MSNQKFYPKNFWYAPIHIHSSQSSIESHLNWTITLTKNVIPLLLENICIQNMDINIFYLWSGKCNWHWIIYQLTLYRSITHLLQIVNQHFTLLSLIQPHIGAVRAYTPGAIKNINPICQVFKFNWKKNRYFDINYAYQDFCVLFLFPS